MPLPDTSVHQHKKGKLVHEDLSYHAQLHFFVRVLPVSKLLVMHANPNDTVRSVHERIRVVTGMPVSVQRLIYRGKHLQSERTLGEFCIEKDAELQLVGILRKTDHKQEARIINGVVALIYQMCGGEFPGLGGLQSKVRSALRDFLREEPGSNCHENLAMHLNLFVYSRAHDAIVMLYLSGYEGNMECAKEVMLDFITNVYGYPKKIQQQCVPVLLKFCKLLRRKCRYDAMYQLFRTSLGELVERIAIGHCVNIKIRDIFPFVCELARKLAHGLIRALVCQPAEDNAFLRDVNDFTSYVLLLSTVIKDQVTVKGPIPIPFCELRYYIPCSPKEVKSLYRSLVYLLETMYLCLDRVEEWLAREEKGEGESPCPGWCHYLSILKALSSLSKIYQGAENEFWTKLRHRKDSFCFLVTRYAKRNDDNQWIHDHKEATSFGCRRHLALMLLPKVTYDYNEVYEMLIDRSQLLTQSFEYITRAEPKALHANIMLKFLNEEATGPGVLREWFCLVCQEIFNPQNALFVACPTDRRRFFPNPASKVHPLHLDYFTFSGRVIALALMHKVQVGILFDRIFFLQLAGMNVSLEDIRDADPFLYSSCKKILEMDPETVDQDALGLTFVREVDELGSIKVVELCLDGENISVNSKNRRKYVDLLIQHDFVTSISEQVTHFAGGFSDIMHCSSLQKHFYRSLELNDFELILHGRESTISVEDWKAHTKYYGYNENDPQILWFWKCIEEMSAEQRKVLLFFWTSVKYLPAEGFSGLASQLYIYKSAKTQDHLTSSQTCFFRLFLPPYPSLNVFQDRLSVITQEHVGCSFGTW